MTNLLGKIFSVINEYSMGYKYKVIIIFGIKIKIKKKLVHVKSPINVEIIHQAYGKIHLPCYDVHNKMLPEEHEIYNKDGEKMRTFFIRDTHFAFAPNNKYHESKYFIWDRYNFGLKTHFYTHQEILNTSGNPDKRYAVFGEVRSIVPDDYKLFDKYKGLDKDFDLIFTHDADLLEKFDNARLHLYYASPWYGTERGGGILNPTAYKTKNKNISILSSNKEMCYMHKIRKNLAKQLKNNELVDTFGTFDGRDLIKIEKLLTDYRFSIVIENFIDSYYITESVTNCFASMTIPIYIGATKISEFFNSDGIIQISVKDLENIDNILKQCTKEDYESRIPAIIDNYNRVQNYSNMWDNLYLNYLKN